MRKTEKVMLIVFLVVSLICGKFLLDYWQDSYENRQHHRQVEEIAFPEKDTEDDGSESNEDNLTTEIDDFDYQALLDENADCIGWLNGYTSALKAPVRCFGNHLSGKRKSWFRTDNECGGAAILKTRTSRMGTPVGC